MDQNREFLNLYCTRDVLSTFMETIIDLPLIQELVEHKESHSNNIAMGVNMAGGTSFNIFDAIATYTPILILSNEDIGRNDYMDHVKIKADLQ